MISAQTVKSEIYKFQMKYSIEPNPRATTLIPMVVEETDRGERAYKRRLAPASSHQLSTDAGRRGSFEIRNRQETTGAVSGCRGSRVACRCRVRWDGYFDFDGTIEIEEAIIVLPGMVPCEVTS